MLTRLSTSALCSPQDFTVRLTGRTLSADWVHPFRGPCLPGATTLEVGGGHDDVHWPWVPTLCCCTGSRVYTWCGQAGLTPVHVHRDTACLSPVFFMAALGLRSVVSVLFKVYHLADTDSAVCPLQVMRCPDAVLCNWSPPALKPRGREECHPAGAGCTGGAAARPRAHCTFEVRLQAASLHAQQGFSCP